MVGFGRHDLFDWYCPRKMTFFEESFDGLYLVMYGMSDYKKLMNVGHLHKDSKTIDLHHLFSMMNIKTENGMSLKAMAPLVGLEKLKSPGAESHMHCEPESIDYLARDVLIASELFDSLLYTTKLSDDHFYALVHLLGYNFVSSQVDRDRVALEAPARQIIDKTPLSGMNEDLRKAVHKRKASNGLAVASMAAKEPLCMLACMSKLLYPKQSWSKKLIKAIENTK